MGKFFISCDEATTICDKNQYGEASFFDRIKLAIHFLTCKICKGYSQQNALMTKIFGNYSHSKCSIDKHLSAEDKKDLEKAIKEKM